MNCTEIDASAQTLIDKIQISWQLLATAAGLPLNLVVLYRLILAQQRPGCESRIFVLYILLNVSNIAILVVYCVGFSIWQLTFWWNAPDWVCKLYKFLDTGVFYLSSNATVSIAVDLCCSILFPMSTRVHGLTRVRALVIGCVLLGVVTSIPQLFLWGTVNAACIDGTTRLQCVFLYSSNPEALVGYSIAHNLVLFWIPLCVIAPCYVRSTVEAYAHFATSKPTASNGRPTLLLNGQQNKHFSPKEMLLDKLRQKHCVPPPKGSTRKNAIVVAEETTRLKKGPSVMILRKAVGGGGGSRHFKDKRSRLVTSSFFIVTAYIFSWLPYQVSSVYELCADDSHLESDAARYFKLLEALMIFDTLINPFLYKLTSSRKTSAEKMTSTLASGNSSPGRTIANLALYLTRTTQSASAKALIDQRMGQEVIEPRGDKVAVIAEASVYEAEVESPPEKVQDHRCTKETRLFSATVDDILKQIDSYEGVVV